MKMKLKILLLLIQISGNVFSQEMNFEWSKIAGTSRINHGKNIIYDDAGYLYVAGEFYGDFSIGDSLITGISTNNIFIIKLDLDGKLIWAKTLGKKEVFGNIALRQICFDANKNIVCTGSFSDKLVFNGKTIYSNGGTDIFILKIKNTGETLSVFSDGGIGDDYSNSICIDKNNDILICGTFKGTSSFGNQSLTSAGNWQYVYPGKEVFIYEKSGFFAKYNNQNKCIFAKLICKNRSELYSIVSDADNNIYTTGFFADYSNITDTVASEVGNFLVFKYDPNGKFIHLIQEGSNNNHIHAKALAIDKQNNLIVTGSIACSECIFGDSILPNSYTDAFLVKYDPSGSMKWIHLIGQHHDADGNSNSSNSIVIDNENNVLITGEFNYINFKGVITKGNNSSIDFLLMKFDQNGHLLNMGKYGNTTWDGGEGLTIDSANKIYITGYTYSGATSTEYPSNIFIGKIDSALSTGIRDEIMTDKIKVYPNPTHNVVFIDLPSEFCQETTIKVFSLDGKIIYNTSTSEKHNEIHLPNTSYKFYVIKLQMGDKVSFEKLVIQ